MHYVIPVLMGSPGGQGGTEGFFVSLLPIAAMVAILWFLLIRPQQKEQQRHGALVKGLKKGDEVVTVGGLYGRIMSLREEKISLKIADGVKVDVDRSKVVRVLSKQTEAEES